MVLKKQFVSTLLVFVIICVICAECFSQISSQQSTQLPPAKRTSLSFTPTYLFRSTLQLGLQHFNRYLDRSINLYGGITGISNEYLKETGYTVEAQYRFYVKRFKLTLSSNNKPYQQGIYVGIWTRGEQFEANYDYQNILVVNDSGQEELATYIGERNVQALSGGVQFGFQHTLKENFFIELYVGGGYRAVIEMEETAGNPRHDKVVRWHNSFFDRAYQGVVPRGGVNFGVVF